MHDVKSEIHVRQGGTEPWICGALLGMCFRFVMKYVMNNVMKARGPF